MQFRELYVGNLPPGVTIPQITEFLNAAMVQLGIAANPQGSVVSAWVSGDGHYAFVEFRSVEECNAALTYLNGLQVGAHQLRVGRPKSFGSMQQQPMVGGGGIGSMPSTMLSGAGLGLGLGGLGGGMMGMGGLGGATAGLGGMNLGGLNAGAFGAFGQSVPSGAGGFGMSTPGLAGSAPGVGQQLQSNALILTNFPLAVGEEQVKELLKPFGQVM